MKSYIAVLAVVVGLIVGMAVRPVAGAAPPSLTETQKLQVQNSLQGLEIMRLRAENAAKDFEAARVRATAYLETLKQDGFDLDLQSLTYVPAKPAAK
jgi:hypothetical protein